MNNRRQRGGPISRGFPGAIARKFALRQRIQRVRLVARSIVYEKLDLIDWLELDHLRVNKLFRALMASRSWNVRDQLFGSLESELLLHATIEEELFYPVAERIQGLAPVILESREEHSAMKSVLGDLRAFLDERKATAGRIALGSAKAPRPDDVFGAKLTVLQDTVEHHVREEEASVFPRFRRAHSREELVRMGDLFESARAQAAGLRPESEIKVDIPA